jgi:hypothetical protein
METEKLIYGKPNQLKYYSYYCEENKHVVATDDYDEYRTHFERINMGGDKGIHSIVKNTEEDGN